MMDDNMNPWTYLNRLAPFFMGLLICANLSGCINLSLPQSTVTRANDASFKAPPSPYASLSNEKADQAWGSSATGNIISFYSECTAKSDFTLRDLQQESLNALEDGQTVEQKEIDFNGRKALRSLMMGRVEGLDMKVEQVLLKKNSCNYILSYTALGKHFEREREHFEAFVNAFKVP